MDLNVVAYAALGLSLFVSAVKMGGWIPMPIRGRLSMPAAGHCLLLRVSRLQSCCGSSQTAGGHPR